MRTVSEMIRAAESRHTNVPEACQHETWMLYQSHAVGDVDHDGDADAVDGWLSEPKSARHLDRHPPIGAVGAWSGGSNGNGHRAPVVAYANGEPVFSSTDAGGRGIRADRTLSWFDRNWTKLHWLGWSETISGEPIKGLWFPEPKHDQPVPAKETHVTPKPKTRGPKIERAIALVKMAKAKPGSDRAKKIRKALDALHDVPFIN